MLGRDYDMDCSIARTLELLGERWTLLILRDIFNGNRRFDGLQGSLGIARNVLTKRLELLVENGILERRRYQERPERYEYRLTERGIDLWPVLIDLMQWGDRHLAGDEGPPVIVRHKDCDGEVDDHRRCERCGADLAARDVYAAPRTATTAQA